MHILKREISIQTYLYLMYLFEQIPLENKVTQMITNLKLIVNTPKLSDITLEELQWFSF